MTKKEKLANRRRTVIISRLHGESITDIAAKLGVTKESVRMDYLGLPKRPKEDLIEDSSCQMPQLDETTICDICMDYLNGEDEETIAQNYGLTYEELHECFYAVSTNNASYNVKNQTDRYIFPVMYNARQRQNIQLSKIYQEIDMSSYGFGCTLKAWKELNIGNAETIASILGISVADICSDAMTLAYSETDDAERRHIIRLARQYFLNAVRNANDINSSDVIGDAVLFAYYISYCRLPSGTQVARVSS